MANIIGVRFKDGGKIYYFDPCGESVSLDDYVVVETSRGVECGRVALAPRDIAEHEVVHPLKKLVRVATPRDIAQVQENHSREKRAFEVCQQKIIDRGLDMKLVEVEYAFDGSKVLFYFTADGRIDFRELVKDLAGVFHTRIELRQIGVRDEAKMLGGLGVCGREFCCASFLRDFQPVTIRMAKEQGLSLNPTKISGACGRLMCCLKYEQEAYEDLIKTTPRVNSVVTTPDGRGTVTETSLLTGIVKVRLDGDAAEIRAYHKDELEGGVRRQSAEPQGDKPVPRPRPERPVVAKPAVPKPSVPKAPKPVPVAPAEQPQGSAPAQDAPAKPRRKHRRGGVRHHKSAQTGNE